jgi:hypothetical protein
MRTGEMGQHAGRQVLSGGLTGSLGWEGRQSQDRSFPDNAGFSPHRLVRGFETVAACVSLGSFAALRGNRPYLISGFPVTNSWIPRKATKTQKTQRRIRHDKQARLVWSNCFVKVFHQQDRIPPPVSLHRS